MARTAGRKGRPWRRFCAAVLAAYGPVCWLCHRPISLDLHYLHRLAYTVDHVVSLQRGGAPMDLANARPAHRSCNSSKGSRAASTREITSRDW